MRPSLALLAVLAACSGGGSPDAAGPAPSPPPDAIVTIDNRPAALLAAPAVNRRLLGSNLQWTDGGDGLLAESSLSYASGPLAGAVALAPTVLRYPGGGQADQYHWAQGVGGLSSRGTCMHVFSGEMQTVRFGTAEFLDLCQRTGAAGMITVNTVSGSPAESAAWVGQVNGSPPVGAAPVVGDWEIGNEPYLENASHPDWDVDATTFAAAYDAHVAAMLAADGRIRVGLPLLGGFATPLLPLARRSWNADVLGAIGQRVDFVAVHNAYLPFYYQHTPVPDAASMLQATLAGAPAVDADLEAMRAQLTAHGVAAPFAMTEHNALMTLFGSSDPVPPSDAIPTTLAGAVYLADLVCVLARRDDVDSAEHWSLISNWMFGAMTYLGAPRPAQRALEGVSAVLNGGRLPAVVSTPTADVPGLGALPAQTAMPLVGALACGDADEVRIILVNRSPDRAMRVRLVCQGGAAHAIATMRTLDEADPLAPHIDGVGTPDWVTSTAVVDADAVTVTLPAHALVTVRIPATPATAPRSDG